MKPSKPILINKTPHDSIQEIATGISDWTLESGITNGKRWQTLVAKYVSSHKTLFPRIFVGDDIVGVRLVINGYHFQCSSIEAAKLEAKERLSTNRGIYLRTY